MTTCDPASYLDAYSFIKVALYRKLNRLFGPESAFRALKDTDLERLISEATMSSNGNKAKSVGQLIERVRKEQPRHLSLMTRVLKAFNPNLIVNMIADDSNVMEVVNRIQEVSHKMLLLRVGYLGSIAYQPEIKTNARDLIPVVARYPNGIYSQELEHMIERLGISTTC